MQRANSKREDYFIFKKVSQKDKKKEGEETKRLIKRGKKERGESNFMHAVSTPEDFFFELFPNLFYIFNGFLIRRQYFSECELRNREWSDKREAGNHRIFQLLHIYIR